VKNAKDAAKAEKRFNRKDKNNDGKLTLDEFKAGKEKGKAGKRHRGKGKPHGKHRHK
jgi:hypothetical protein